MRVCNKPLKSSVVIWRYFLQGQFGCLVVIFPNGKIKDVAASPLPPSRVTFFQSICEYADSCNFILRQITRVPHNTMVWRNTTFYQRSVFIWVINKYILIHIHSPKDLKVQWCSLMAEVTCPHHLQTGNTEMLLQSDFLTNRQFGYGVFLTTFITVSDCQTVNVHA